MGAIMNKIRTSEIFASPQGEGRRTGMNSLWVRFFGCNLKCDGFGQTDPTDRKTYTLPYENFNAKDIKNVNHLPVFERGCDSSYSWNHKYKHLATDRTLNELLEEVFRVGKETYGLDYLNFEHKESGEPIQLCFTGGEPMLHQKQLANIFRVLKEKTNLSYVNIETNATIHLTEEFRQTIVDDIGWDIFSKMMVTCSPKLFHVSGERDGFHTDVINEYQEAFPTGDIKVVMNSDPRSWEELLMYMNEIEVFDDWRLWIMPVGATLEQQTSKEIQDIAREAMMRGWNISQRAHVHLWGNAIGT